MAAPSLVPRLAAALLFLAAAWSCRTSRGGDEGVPIVQPGAPGQASRVITTRQALELPAVTYTDADVRFMQGMLSHHAQALEMTALVPSRSTREDLRLLARRIDASQQDEIAFMRQWLERRRQSVPDTHAHHAANATLMPGMLTPDEMAALAAASGAEFERLFLTGMIKHHEGALVMVEELFATAGAGQEADVFAFTTDVNADQSIEIERMRGMLGSQ
jgi:uncharacterized protein (DUF305 family)